LRQYIYALFIGAAVLGAAACDEKLSTVAGPTSNLTPTFSSIRTEIFNAGDSSGRAACISCHTTNGRPAPAGNQNFDTPDLYQQLVNAPSARNPGATLVVPGDPDASYLVHKLEGAADIVGARMPLGGPYLTDGQISIIRTWIARGAAND
jgi:mono/diheme cytochrome c family protein